jgi:hypothetical protein
MRAVLFKIISQLFIVDQSCFISISRLKTIIIGNNINCIDSLHIHTLSQHTIAWKIKDNEKLRKKDRNRKFEKVSFIQKIGGVCNKLQYSLHISYKL